MARICHLVTLTAHLGERADSKIDRVLIKKKKSED